MRTFRLQPPAPAARAGRALRALLAGGLLPSAAAGLLPLARWPVPFGVPRPALALLLALVAGRLAWVGWRAGLTRAGRLLGGAAWLALVLAAALGAELLVRTRATGFYTARVLADALAVLLLGHLAGTAADALVPAPPAPEGDADGPDFAAEARRRRARWLVRGDRAADLPSAMDGAALALVGAFAALAAAAWREVAGVALLAAGVVVLLAVPLRFARAWIRAGRPGHRRARRALDVRRRRHPPAAW